MGCGCTAGIGPTAGCLRGCLAAAGGGTAAAGGSRDLAIAALVSWLITEALGAFMLRSWFASGGMRRRHAGTPADGSGSGGVSLPVMLGHAGLAFTGFVCWVSFVVTQARPAAWLAIAFLGPGIGFGISTVTVWTPYGGDPPQAREWTRDDRPGSEAGSPGPSEKALVATLADEALTSMLVDETVARLLAESEPEPRGQRWNFKPLVPAAHGVLAVATFFLATLAAITAL
jgi:hypothetical protein